MAIQCPYHTDYEHVTINRDIFCIYKNSDQFDGINTLLQYYNFHPINCDTYMCKEFCNLYNGYYNITVGCRMDCWVLLPFLFDYNTFKELQEYLNTNYPESIKYLDKHVNDSRIPTNDEDLVDVPSVEDLLM